MELQRAEKWVRNGPKKNAQVAVVYLGHQMGWHTSVFSHASRNGLLRRVGGLNGPHEPGATSAEISHSTVTAQSQHSHRTVTAQSPHSHRTGTAQSQRLNQHPMSTGAK